MLQGAIQVTSFDMDRLFSMIEQLRKNGFPETDNLARLEDELARSEEVPSEQVGADVVTMNSRVLLRDEANGHEMSCTLVFPSDADASANRISVVAPLGTAILGYRVGDVIDWAMPGGVRQYRILKIDYQPEAAGDFHL
ncbi:MULTISPECIES: nucleoside diphosphate kinase regulator [Methylobacillus]|uniref:GreA/GreB family elongation factor n=1 Tax=Methylobacillus flagellatus (strain ATCC 51484 / DSM 6875 / VKM B-1610 / KT) TaxID=265072 RepID=Q1H3Z9_METFK|nr:MULTISPECIES: nucleoside diphosphate kinase regulator [Methylobacillus]ABE48788.1 GreA/GreB family elongation factor [Methylobacillus flagellatus KT]MPS49438.1 nucleoside diphosphate kinase regulator [Methylobacillus sp.]